MMLGIRYPNNLSLEGGEGICILETLTLLWVHIFIFFQTCVSMLNKNYMQNQNSKV